jgi:N-acetyl sugar amidotransferase
MKHCRRCLYPETKPSLWFDESGLCSACIAFDARKQIDWEAREDEFGRHFTGRDNRVVAAVSGGKDSTYIVVKLLERGLRPIAVCATTDDLTPIGRRNLDNIGRLTDLIEVTPNKTLRRQMSKYALETVGDISWCEHVLIWTVPAQIADLMGIGHVFYGENPQNEYGAGPKASQQLAGMPPQWEQEFGGMLGLRVSDMQEQFPDGEFGPYKMPKRMPHRDFLGYYFPWDGEANAWEAHRHGFEWLSDIVETSCVSWENIDNHQTGIHDYLRYVKYGYTRAHDILGSAIRRGKIDRPTAVKFIKGLDPVPHTYIGKPMEKILGDIGMTVPEFWAVVYRFANQKLFTLAELGFHPVPKFEVA